MISDSFREAMSLANKRGRTPDSRMEATDLAARRISEKEANDSRAKSARLAALRRARDESL